MRSSTSTLAVLGAAAVCLLPITTSLSSAAARPAAARSGAAAAKCPHGEAETAPGTTAYFNDPRNYSTAPKKAKATSSDGYLEVVHRMEDLICSVPQGATIRLAMYHYDGATANDVTADLTWAQSARNATIRVAVDHSVKRTTTTTVDGKTTTSPTGAWAKLLTLGGASVRLCGHHYDHGTKFHGSCVGNGTLHDKLMLVSAAGTARDIVMVGSQNLNPNAVHSGFQNMAQIVGNPALYSTYTTYFGYLWADKKVPDIADRADLKNPSHPVASPDGTAAQGVTAAAYFFPRNTDGTLPSDTHFNRKRDERTDTVAALLKGVRCTPKGGGPHTSIHIAMQNIKFRNVTTDELVKLARQGCAIHIVYDVLKTAGTKKYLTSNGIDLVQLRDGTYRNPAGPGDERCIFVHDKFLTVNSAAATGTTQVWTGSENYQQEALHHDDETMVVLTERAYDADHHPVATPLFTTYLAHWHTLDTFASKRSHQHPNGSCSE